MYRLQAKIPKRRRPFWLPAPNYYVMTAAISVALFFLLWSVLHDSGDEMPWATAGVAASAVLLGAVFLREFVLRRARDRYLTDERRLDRSLQGIGLSHAATDAARKLTLEKNSYVLHEIKKKSEAAKILGRFAEGHKEVFEMCGQYLSINNRELARVSPGSPRLAALLKGKDLAEEFHRYHLLQWAEIEARTLTADAKNRARVAEKLEAAQKALNVVDTALNFYPNENSLLESGQALEEFIASIKMSNWIDRAERAADKGNHKQAIKLYRDALNYLEKERTRLSNTEEAANRIKDEIEKLGEQEPS